MMEPNAQYQSMVQFLTTEHFTLQTARSATITESTGRASLFLGTVSSGVVALALVAQVSGVGTAFFGFAAILLPVLFFLGMTTISRLTASSVEYWLYSRSINRVRRFYVESVPGIAKYLAIPPRDDFASTASSQAIRVRRSQGVVTLAGAVMVITSVIAGVFVGLVVELLFNPQSLVPGAVGVLTFLLGAALLFWRQGNQFLARATADFAPWDLGEGAEKEL